MFRHQVDHRVLGLRVEFHGICIGIAEHMPRIFDHSQLHSQADPQKRDFLFARIPDRLNFPLYAALSKAAGDQNAIGIPKDFRHICKRNLLGIHPLDLDLHFVSNAAMGERFRYAEIGVVQFDVFSYQRDGHLGFQIHRGIHHGDPFAQIRPVRIQTKVAADNIVQPFVPQSQRDRIQKRQVQVFNDAILAHIAEQGNLFLLLLPYRLLRAQDNHIRLDTQAQKLFHAVLCGLCLLLMGAGDIRDQRHMDKQAVGTAHLDRKLADRL